MIFITAEIASHWQGDFGVLEDMLKTLKLAGVNAVKLQALDVEKICRHPELKYYEDSSVSPRNIDHIDSVCKRVGIDWYATVCYADAVEFLDPYVNRFKISVAGSKDEKIKDAVFSTGKEVIISTEKPFKTDDPRIKNLYCVPSYPCEYGEINFNIIQYFDGYSNHCTNGLAVLNAVEYGAKYIEFHVTPSRDYYLLDNKVSFTYLETFDIIRWIRNYESWYNTPGSISERKISKQSFNTSKR